mmetsp:Transcript_15179/g.49399  ORF Transcript_15179/g.49399 Transcript_15179/m.49399 type:complete len:845 (-) Transcript_15179:546-3080(-)
MGNICKISATSTRSASPVEDPVTAHRTNALLNRWRSGEVIALQRLFRGAKKRKKDLGLEKAAFVELFPKLHSKALCDAVFSLFDSTGNGSVSFRDFCRALAWCGRGTRAEKLRFLFCLFVIYEQQQQQLRGKSKHADLENGAAASPLAALPAIGGSTAAALPANPNVLTTTTQTTQQQQQQGGLLGGPHQQPQQAPPPPPKQQHHRHTSSSSESTTTAQHQHQHPPTSPKQQQQTTQLLHEELALGDLDDDVDSPRLGILGLDALAHFAGRPPTTAVEDDARLNFKHFVAWADRYLPESVVDDALEPLAVLSTPRSERDAVQAALADADIRPGDAAFVLSKDWWNAWCRYAGYTVPRPPPPKHKGDDDDDEGERRNGAEEQNFNLLSLGLVVDSGKGGSENDDDDDSEDAENAKAAVVVVVDEGTTTKKPPPTTSGAAGNTTNQRDPRPSEMDNSSLLYGSDDEIAPDLSLGVDFVLVPREVWDCFGRWYGGGPALPRTAVDEGTFDLRPLSLRVAACDTRGDLPYFAPRRLERFHVDLDLATLERSEVLLRALFFANGGVTTQGSSSSLNTTSSHHHHHHHHSHRSGKNGHATTTSGGDDDSAREAPLCLDSTACPLSFLILNDHERFASILQGSHPSLSARPTEDLAPKKKRQLRFPLTSPEATTTFDVAPLFHTKRNVVRWYAAKVPRLKLIVVLSPPADRLASLLPPERLVALGTVAKRRRLLAQACYVDHLEPWLAALDRRNVALVKAHLIVVNPAKLLREVHAFLGLPALASDRYLSFFGGAGAYTPEEEDTLDPAARRALNCLPDLARCQDRLLAALDAPPNALDDWCPSSASSRRE